MSATAIASVRFAPGDRVLWVGANDGGVDAFDVATGAVVRRLAGHLRPVLDIDFCAGNTDVVTASRDGTIAFWSCASGAFLRSVDVSPAATTPVACPCSRSRADGACGGCLGAATES